MPQHDHDEIRTHLLAEDRGFYILRDFYTPEEIDAYRSWCEKFLETGPVIQTRINSNRMPDYIHHRSHDRAERTQRIYQYFHNHASDDVGAFLRRARELRDEIESAWLEEPVYRGEKERLQDYMIVTRYTPGTGMLPRHRDYEGPAPRPLIQFWVLLSEPEKDYRDGNLVLYSRNGQRFRVESELGVRKGDALIFDKSLQHEVEMTGAGSSDGRGRWTLLIGARAKRDPYYQIVLKRIAFHPWMFPATRTVRDLLRRPPQQKAAA